ncbi:MAG: sodium:solute symporter [Bacteroidales bacterium]|nr:sodium:solute symporter [Bacteroidales bacterium]
MHIVDLIVFLLFTGGIVVFGCSFWRKQSTADAYTAGGRAFPGWVVGMSIFATYISSISYLGYPGKAFAADWNAFVFSLSIPIASYFAARHFVPFYRSQGSVSAYTFLEERFGAWARIYASSCYLLTQIARMGSILYLLALPMYVLMGWNIQLVIVVTSMAIIAYAVLGGLKAAIWTEAVQGIVLIGGALVCLIVLLCSMPDGPAQTVRMGWDAGKFSLGDMGSSMGESTFWVCLIYGVFINLQNYGIDQNYVQRYHAAKSLKEAKFSALFGGYLTIPVNLVFFMIGTALWAYYQVHTGDISADMAQKPDYVFPYFIVNALPVGLTGLLVASIFAAGMSTVATSITSSSTIILTDYYKPLRKHCSDREGLWVLKVSSAATGLLGIVVALAMLSVENIIDAWWKLSSVFSGGMLGLFLLGYLSRRTKQTEAIIAVACGVVVIGWISAWKYVGLDNPHIHENLSIVFGTLAIFLTGLLLTVLTGKRKRKNVGNQNI